MKKVTKAENSLKTPWNIFRKWTATVPSATLMFPAGTPRTRSPSLTRASTRDSLWCWTLIRTSWRSLQCWRTSRFLKSESLLWVFFYFFFAVNWTVGVLVIAVFVSITILFFKQNFKKTNSFSRNLQKSLRRFFKFFFFSGSELDFSSMQGFMAIVTNSVSYPLTALKNLRIKPGHDNLVALKAVDVQADKWGLF